MNNPFKQDTTSHNDWEVLKDLQWHCTKCELKSGQAKTWQVWRQNGIQLDKDEKGKWFKTKLCSSCKMKTVHRKLKVLEVLEDTKVRSGMPQALARKIKTFYKNEEALFLREFPTRELEIDHKFPQIRWINNEVENKTSMSENEIKSKFILLTRSNNLLKSRQCERCVKSEIRGNFPGVYFWYKGNKKWGGENIHDEKGCVGCFWYDPYKWREELNKLVNK
jgi:ribosomal protein L28